MKASIVMDLFHLSIISCGVIYLIKNAQSIKVKAQEVTANLKNCCCSQK